MTHLFSNYGAETGQEGQSNPSVSPWAQYLRQVAKARGENRVHLADAWCGMSGVRPRGRAPVLEGQEVELPEDLTAIGQREGQWIALAIGAGDSARCVPPAVWGKWIRTFLTQMDEGRVVLVGSGHEREAGQAVLEAIPPLMQGRVWDTTGRTTVTQLISLLGRCGWVIGADTGPLHLATAVGSRAVGFYFARARVHETGPYGEGHWVYQHATQAQPDSWPITQSIELIRDGHHPAAPDWALWKSHMDRWGVFFDDGSGTQAIDLQRATMWRSLSPTLYESVAA